MIGAQENLLQYVLLLWDPLDEPNASKGMRLEHLGQFLKQLYKGSHILQLEYNILCQNCSKLYGLPAYIELLKTQVVNLVLLYFLVEDVQVNI